MELAAAGGRPGLRRRNQLINAGGLFQQLRALFEEGFHVVHRIAGPGYLIAGGIHVNHETCRRHADQHQHDQTNAFLAVVRTV